MAHGLHQNLMNEAFVRTPPCQTQKVVNNLLRFAGTGTIFDPTCGEGDLLEPFAQAGHRIVGVELHRERASEAQERMPDATIIASPLEAVRGDGAFADVLALNPPYFLQNGKRAEYSITKEALEYLRPGGIAFGVYPARSAWKADLVMLWAKALRDVQVFRFPDGNPETDEFAFQKFTQIVVIGVKREQPLAEPDPGELARLRGFRYRKPDKETGSWWAGGTPPPILPDTPSEDGYTVTPPRIPLPVSYTLMKADVAEMLKAITSHGAHLDASWTEDTTFSEDTAVEPCAMPIVGPAHIAAEILNGMFDGDVVLNRYLVSTLIMFKMVNIAPDDEQRQKGVCEIRRTTDHAILGVLDTHSGEVTYHAGDDAFAFITPLLPQLTPLVLSRRRPRYMPEEARDWELEVVARIGRDKTLPGAKDPGLADQQVHRVLAMWRMLNGQA